MAEVIIVDRVDDAVAIAARVITDLIARKSDAVLGVATGSTPLAVYRALAVSIADQATDVSRVSAFALDEYVGLPDGHPESYRAVVAREVVTPLGLDPALVHVPRGSLETITHAGEEYDRAIADAGGVDLQILGIGANGHIGFNEPGSSFGSRTRVKTLAEQTRRDNARFFDDPSEVPLHCITQGLGTILQARHLLLLAFGATKADAIAGALEGPVSTRNPGSAMQLHPHATVIIDEAAAARLADSAYYRHAWANKPAWQGI